MITSGRITALQSFGYDRDEARFLCIAALQSGYFVRRQFLSFIGGTKGWKDVALIKKLKANRHCQITVYRHQRMVYHLSAKPLYVALGEPDNRNRRERQPSTIKNKLMGLDFVLEHLPYRYLATEREKLDYFVGALKISLADLTTRWYESARGRGKTAKYFVDKYPLFLAILPGGDAPVVHFCYLDEGAQSSDGFGTYLDQYGRLFAALADFRVIYIAKQPGLLQSAQRRFEELSNAAGRQNTPVDSSARPLLDYFEARQQYEARDFSMFDAARVIRYREQKKHFAGEQYEALYGQWQARGTAAVVAAPHLADAKEIPVDRFSTYVLEHDYDLFGTLTTVPAHGAVAAGAQTRPKSLGLG
jgi:hypothetical protein